MKRFYRDIWPEKEILQVMENLKELEVNYTLRIKTHNARIGTFIIDESETSKLPVHEGEWYLPTCEEMDSGKSMFELGED